MKRRVVAALTALAVTISSMPQMAMPIYAAEGISDADVDIILDEEVSGQEDYSLDYFSDEDGLLIDEITVEENSEEEIEESSSEEASSELNPSGDILVENDQDVPDDAANNFTDIPENSQENEDGAEVEILSEEIFDYAEAASLSSGDSSDTLEGSEEDGEVAGGDGEVAGGEVEITEGEGSTTEAEIPSLTLGVAVKATVTEENPIANFSFTAPEAGRYYFSSIEDENELDTYGELYTSDGTLLKYNDDDKDMQFGISYVMEQGQIVVLKVRRYNGGAGSFDIIVEKDTRVYPEKITLSDTFRKVYIEGIDTGIKTSDHVILTYKDETSQTVSIYGKDSYGNQVDFDLYYDGKNVYRLSQAGTYTIAITCGEVSLQEEITVMELSGYMQSSLVSSFSGETPIEKNNTEAYGWYDYVFTAPKSISYCFSYAGDEADITVYDMAGKLCDEAVGKNESLKVDAEQDQTYLVRVMLLGDEAAQNSFTLSVSESKAVTNISTATDTYTVVYAEDRSRLCYNMEVGLTYADETTGSVTLSGDSARDTYGNKITISLGSYKVGECPATVSCGELTKDVTLNVISRLNPANPKFENYPTLSLTKEALTQDAVSQTASLSETDHCAYLKVTVEETGDYQFSVSDNSVYTRIYDANEKYLGGRCVPLTAGETYLLEVSSWKNLSEATVSVTKRTDEIKRIEVNAPEKFYSGYNLASGTTVTVTYKDDTPEDDSDNPREQLGLENSTESGRTMQVVLTRKVETEDGTTDGTEYGLYDLDNLEGYEKYGSYLLSVSYGEVKAEEVSVTYTTREDAAVKLTQDTPVQISSRSADVSFTAETAGLYRFYCENGVSVYPIVEEDEMFFDVSQCCYLGQGETLLLCLESYPGNIGSVSVEKLSEIKLEEGISDTSYSLDDLDESGIAYQFVPTGGRTAYRFTAENCYGNLWDSNGNYIVDIGRSVILDLSKTYYLTVYPGYDENGQLLSSGTLKVEAVGVISDIQVSLGRQIFWTNIDPLTSDDFVITYQDEQDNTCSLRGYETDQNGYSVDRYTIWDEQGDSVESQYFQTAGNYSCTVYFAGQSFSVSGIEVRELQEESLTETLTLGTAKETEAYKTEIVKLVITESGEYSWELTEGQQAYLYRAGTFEMVQEFWSGTSKNTMDAGTYYVRIKNYSEQPSSLTVNQIVLSPLPSDGTPITDLEAGNWTYYTFVTDENTEQAYCFQPVGAYGEIRDKDDVYVGRINEGGKNSYILNPSESYRIGLYRYSSEEEAAVTVSRVGLITDLSARVKADSFPAEIGNIDQYDIEVSYKDKDGNARTLTGYEKDEDGYFISHCYAYSEDDLYHAGQDYNIEIHFAGKTLDVSFTPVEAATAVTETIGLDQEITLEANGKSYLKFESENAGWYYFKTNGGTQIFDGDTLAPVFRDIKYGGAELEAVAKKTYYVCICNTSSAQDTLVVSSLVKVQSIEILQKDTEFQFGTMSFFERLQVRANYSDGTSKDWYPAKDGWSDEYNNYLNCTVTNAAGDTVNPYSLLPAGKYTVTLSIDSVSAFYDLTVAEREVTELVMGSGNTAKIQGNSSALFMLPKDGKDRQKVTFEGSLDVHCVYSAAQMDDSWLDYSSETYTADDLSQTCTVWIKRLTKVEDAYLILTNTSEEPVDTNITVASYEEQNTVLVSDTIPPEEPVGWRSTEEFLKDIQGDITYGAEETVRKQLHAGRDENGYSYQLDYVDGDAEYGVDLPHMAEGIYTFVVVQRWGNAYDQKIGEEFTVQISSNEEMATVINSGTGSVGMEDAAAGKWYLYSYTTGDTDGSYYLSLNQAADLRWMAAGGEIQSLEEASLQYTLELSANTTYYFLVRPESSGSLEISVTESPKSLVIDFTDTETAYTYTGSEITPGITVKNESGDVVNVDFYTTDYSNNINAGTATVTVTGKGIYTGCSDDASFTISPKDIASASLSFGNIPDGKYHPLGYCPVPTVTDTIGGETYELNANRADYSIEYQDSDKVGTASMVLTGVGNYCGTKTLEYQVLPLEESDLLITGVETSYSETGHEIKPVIEIHMASDSHWLFEGENYSVTYQNCLDPGIASVVINGIDGSIKSPITITYTITAAEISAYSVKAQEIFSSEKTAPESGVSWYKWTDTSSAVYLLHAPLKEGAVADTAFRVYKKNSNGNLDRLTDELIPINAEKGFYVVPAMAGEEYYVRLTDQAESLQHITADAPSSVIIEGEETTTGWARIYAGLSYWHYIPTRSGSFTISMQESGTLQVYKKSGEGFVKEQDLPMTASETEGVSEEGSGETAVSVLYSAVCSLTEGTEYYLVFDGTSEKFDRPLWLELAEPEIETLEEGENQVYIPYGNTAVYRLPQRTGKTYVYAVLDGLTMSVGTKADADSIASATGHTVAYCIETAEDTSSSEATATDELFLTITNQSSSQNSVEMIEIGTPPEVTATINTESLPEKIAEGWQDLASSQVSVDLTSTGTTDSDPVNWTYRIREGVDKYGYGWTVEQADGTDVEAYDTEASASKTYTYVVTMYWNCEKVQEIGTFHLTTVDPAEIDTMLRGTFGTSDSQVKSRAAMYSFTPAVSGTYRLQFAKEAWIYTSADEVPELAYYKDITTVKGVPCMVMVVPKESGGSENSSYSLMRTDTTPKLQIALNDSGATYTYSGLPITPEYVVTDVASDYVLEKDVDYTVTWYNNTRPGTGSVVANGIGEYNNTDNVSKTCHFTIEKAPLSAVNFPCPSYPYTGSEVNYDIPYVEFGNHGVGLADYTVSYGDVDRINVGEKTATLTATENSYFVGSTTVSFKVVPKQLTGAAVTFPEYVIYAGASTEPEITVSLDGKTLEKDKDYTVQYSGNASVGTATATLTGKGNYTGYVQESFTIESKNITDTDIIAEPVQPQTHTGEAVTPIPTIKYMDELLICGTDFTLSYENNVSLTTQESKAVVVVTGTGNYTGTRRLEFSIVNEEISVDDVAPEALKTDQRYAAALTEKWYEIQTSESDILYLDAAGETVTGIRFYELSEDSTKWSRQEKTPFMLREESSQWILSLDGGKTMGILIPAGVSFTAKTSIPVQAGTAFDTGNNPDGWNIYRFKAETAGTFGIFAEQAGAILAINENAATEEGNTATGENSTVTGESSMVNGNYLSSADVSYGIAARYPNVYLSSLEAGDAFFAIPAGSGRYEVSYYPDITKIRVNDTEESKNSLRRMDTEFFTGTSFTVSYGDNSSEIISYGQRDSYGRTFTHRIQSEKDQTLYLNGQILPEGRYTRLAGYTNGGLEELDFSKIQSESGFTVQSMENSYQDNTLALGEAMPLKAETEASPEIYVLQADQDWKYVITGTAELQVQFYDENGQAKENCSGLEFEWELEKGTYYFRLTSEAETEVSVTASKKAAPEQIRYVEAYGDVDSIGISWATAPKLGTTYELYRRVSGEEAFSLLASFNKRSTTYYHDRDIAADTVYEYYVVAKDGRYVSSEPSEIVSGTLGKDQEAPVVKSLKPEKGSRLNKTVEFSASAGDNVAVAGIKLQIRDDSAETWADLKEAEGDNCSISIDTAGYPDGTYYVRALAYDAAGNESSPLEYKYQFDNTPPETVTGIWTEATATTATIHWLDVESDDLSFFRVERKAEDGSWVQAGDTDTTLGMNFTSLAPGTTYVYRVTSYDTLGNAGTPTGEIPVTTLEDTTAPVISGLSPKSGRFCDSIPYTVTGSDEYGVKKIQIQYSCDLVTWTDVTTESFAEPQKTRSVAGTLDISTLEESLLYMRGLATDFSENVSDDSENAPYVTLTVDHTAPAAPKGVLATSGDGYLNISWERGSEEDLGLYEIYKSTDDVTYVLLADKLASLNYVDRDVESGKTYYYKVKVWDQAGNLSAFSAESHVTAQKDTIVPVIQSVNPADGSSFAASGEKLQISAAVTDNRKLSEISFYWKTSEEEAYTLIGNPITTDKICEIAVASLPTENIEDGQRIYLKVEAVDAEGNKADPVEIICTADKVAPEVYSLTAEFNEEERIVDISWSSGQEEDLQGYYVYRKTENEAWSLLASRAAVEGQTDYEYTDWNIPETGGTFIYKIEAVDKLGNTKGFETEAVTISEVPEEESIPLPTAVIQCENLMEIGVEYLFDASSSIGEKPIEKYQFDFGDGEVVSGQKNTVIHKYTQEGHYTVRLTVWDENGSENLCEREITVREHSTLGNVEITVVDYEGKTVANAPVYFDLGSSNQFIRNTNSFGTVTITAGVGTHAVGCFKDGYLPVKTEVLLLSGETVKLQLEIKEEPLVTGEFEVHRMSLEEIIAAGIDITVPENQYVAEVTVHMTYKEEPIDYSFQFDWNWNLINPKPIELEDTDGTKRKIIPVPIPVPNPGPIGDDDDDSDGWPDGWPDEKNVTVALLDIPVGVSALKEFFDVKLHILNHASAGFDLLDNDVTLLVPEGLSIVKTNTSLPEAHTHIDSIAGGSSETLQWILRGDQIGKYYLSADYEGTLSAFQTRVSAQFKAQDPIEVYGLSNAKLKITIPETIGIYGEDHKGMLEYTLQFKNEGSIDLYLPRLSVREEDVVYSTLYVSSEGSKLLEAGEFPQALHPGEYIEMSCSMDAEGYELYKLYNWYTEVYSSYGLQVEVEVLSDEVTDNSILFTESEDGLVLGNKDITINGAGYTTDAEGCIYLTAGEIDAISENMQVSAYGYFDYLVEKEKILGKDGTHQIVMKVKDSSGDPYVSSLYYRQVKMEGETPEGPWKDGLADSLALYEDTEEYYTYVMTAGWNENPVGKYVLQQSYGGKLESETGVFSELLLNRTFEVDRPIYAYVVSANGKSSEPVKTKISLQLAERNPLRLFGGTLQIGSNLEFTIPDEFPIIGGNKMSLDLDDMPIFVKAEGYDVQVGINVDVDKKDDWSLAKKYFSKMEGTDSTQAAQMASQLGKKVGAKSKVKNFLGDAGNVSVSVLGYIQMTYTEGQAYEITEGALAVTLDISGSIKEQLVDPPVFFVLKFGTKFGASGTVSRPVIESSLPFTYNVELSFAPYLKATGGVGFKDIIAVELTGGVETKVIWNLSSGYQRVLGKADVTIKGYVGPFTFLEKELYSDEKLLYEHNNAEAATVSMKDEITELSYEEMLAMVYDAQNYAAEPPSYEYQENWNTDLLKAAAQPEEPELAEDEQLLQDNVYPDARQIMAETNDTKMMLWLSQDSARSAQNSTILVYSLYDEKNDSWSTPKPVLDDGTADLYPKAAVVNDTIYIIWQNTSKVLSDTENTLADLAANAEICTAYYQKKANRFVPVSAQGSQAESYSDPVIVSQGDDMYSVWVANTEKDIFGIKGSNSILASRMTEEGWSSPQTLASDLPMVAAYDAAIWNGGLRVACSLETDLNIITSDDWELYEYCWSADDTFTQRRITENTVEDSAPLYSEENGRGVLYWNQDGVTARTYFDTSEIQETLNLAAGNNRKQIVTENGTYLLWIGDSKEVRQANEIYCAAYEEATGTYGDPVCITDRKRSITSFQARADADGTIELIYQARSVTAEDDTVSYGNSSFYRQIILPEADLAAIDNGNIQAGRIFPGATVDIDVLVENQGMFPADGYLVQVLDESGKAVVTKNYTEVLPAGASKEITIPYLLPLEFKGQTYTVRTVLGAGYESNTDNNSFELNISGKEIELLSVNTVRKGNTAVCTVKVKNNGSVDLESVILDVREDTPDGTLLGSVTLGEISYGRTMTWTYELDLTKIGKWRNKNAVIYFIVSEGEVSGGDAASDSDTASDSDAVSDRRAAVIHVDRNADLLYDISMTQASEEGVNASLYVQNDSLADKTEMAAAVVYAEDGSILGCQTAEFTVKAGETLKQVVSVPVAELPETWTVWAGAMIPVAEIVLDQKEATVKLDDTITLKARVSPESAFDTNVYWTSSDPAIASVENGVVTAHKLGTATITCKAADGYGAKAECVVTVREKHIWGIWKTKTSPTCTQAGTEIRHCLDEGCTESQERIGAAALGHTGGNATCQSRAVCSRCGVSYGNLGSHSYSAAWTVDTAPTCLSAGSKSHHCTVSGCTARQDITVISKLNGTIKLTASKLPIQIKKSASLKTLVTGLMPGDYISSWQSSNSKIVTVNASGKITGKKVGKAVITVTLASGAYASVTVTVQAKAVTTTKILNLTSKLTVKKGGKAQLSPILSPITSLEKVTYSSSNKKVATVSSKGLIVAKASGSAKITVKAGKKKFVVTVTVPKVAPTKITGVPSAKTLKKGKTYTLKPKLSPKGAEAKISYKSSNKSVASVDSKGKVTAKKKGTAVITITAGKVKTQCKITVN